MKLEISDWNMIPYAGAWSRQTEWFDALVHAKQAGEGYVNHIVLCEHPHVYTLGRSGKERNMLLGEEQLRRIGATLYHIDRGGDITYHGPGQLVCYPILNLEDFSLGLKEYVHLLEEAVIRVCASFGIAAGRLEKATGVWLEGDTPRARKICAIGVRSSHFVTMHGLALNVNTDLRYFSYINPCGFIDKGVTSLQNIFLSGPNRKVQLGNFVGDAVKGSSYKNYPPDIAKGIQLHRAIDDYTDHHPAVCEVVHRLQPEFGRYSGVLLDIYFDYLLASRFESFSGVSLRRYTRTFYLSLLINYRYLPLRFKRFIWHFILTDRLRKYATPNGIRESLNIMVEYHHIDISVDKAIRYLEEHDEELFAVFQPFFIELQRFCTEYRHNYKSQF